MISAHNNPVLQVSCRSRPQRVALLVDPTTTSADDLDRIFAWAMTCWGGRYHGAFPVVSGSIPEAWRKPLDLLDPDVVVTFGDLSHESLDRIERAILPARIFGLRVEDRRRLIEGDHFGLPGLDPIGVRAIPHHIWSNRGPLGDPVFVLFKRRYPIEKNDRLVLRNFGVLPDDVGTKAAFRDLPTQLIAEGPAALSELVQLRETGRQVVLPIDLCSHEATFPAVLDYEQQTRGLHLVVGDSVYDAIYHWNRALVAHPTHGRSSFWLPAGAITNETILDATLEWIDRFYWAPDGFRSGVVASYSLTLAQLGDVAEALSRGSLRFSPRVLSPEDYPFPKGDPVTLRDFGPSFRLGSSALNAQVQTQQIPFADGKALIEPITPPFLDRSRADSDWMVDVQLRFHPERYSYTNVRPDWALPRRWGLAELFIRQEGARLVGQGLPAAQVQGSSAKLTLRVPQDRDVFWSLIFGNPYALAHAGIPTRKTRYSEMWTSDEGASLRGMLRLFGTVYHCGRTLGDPFWGPVLKVLANGKPSRRRACSLAWLRQQFGRMKNTTRDAQQDLHYWDGAVFDEYRHSEFEGLVRAGIFTQGTEIRCQNCGSTFWYRVDHLGQGTTCAGCGETIELPIEAGWSYRLNDLVGNVIEGSGTCAVVHALCLLERAARGMFLYLPCQNLAVEQGGPPVTDVDILALVDGRFVIGEVKSSPRGFQQSEIDKSVALAKELRPDELVFAAPEDGWPEDVDASIAAAAATLHPLGIKSRAMKMSW